MFQPVLPLHECADPTATEHLHFVVDSAAEPLQFIADYVTTGAALTETS
jgi:hypothetical protein